MNGIQNFPTDNIQNVCIIPPAYTGPVRPGHLVFNADFESGNLGRVDYISEFEYDLFIRPDTGNQKFRMWFNFTVENTRINQRIIFNIVNFSKTRSLYREGMSPVVKSTSRPKWMRIPQKNVYYYRCPEHRRNYVMSFAFCFDNERDVYQFAYCFPYTYTQLQRYLDGIERKCLSFFRREVLTTTLEKRSVDILTISKNAHSVRRDEEKIVFITARVHPGESPASFVVKGVIDFLTSDQPAAKLLRDNLVFMIVPMLNPDGVYNGNYRCSVAGVDLNRHWLDPSPYYHPAIYATKQLLLDLGASQNDDLEFFIDIHAHSTLMNGFMYGNVFEDTSHAERQEIFPRLFWHNAQDFSLTNTSFNSDAVKAGTGRRALGGILGEHCNCYTLEVSFYSYMTSSSQIAQPYSEQDYMKLGENLSKTFIDYYQLNPRSSV